MDLIGHCVTAELSGLFKEEDIYGPRIVELLFLNYMHCHDWAYKKCWTPENFGEYKPVIELIRAHMIGDWVIHYGNDKTHIKKKNGWAYRRMKPVHALKFDFFKRATDLKLFQPGVSWDLSLWGKKKKLDWSHSLVEYAVDFLLAPKLMVNNRFEKIKKGLSRLASEEGYGSSSWAWNMFKELEVFSDQSPEFLQQSIARMAADAIDSKRPEEFTIRTTLHKYKMIVNEESIAFVEEYIQRIADYLDKDEVAQVCDDIADNIRDFSIFYTGSWQE